MAVGSFRLPSGGASLIVDFSVDDATPDTNQIVTFTDLTVGATSWVWDFGDGTSSSLQNPTKTYLYAGTYTVTLCATNGSTSGKEVKTNFIVCSLQPLPSANLQMYNEALIGATPANATLVSGAISQWNDNINGYHRTQGTPVNRPAYIFPAITAPTGIQYGAARYDGNNDFLQNADAAFVRATGSFEVILFKRNSQVTVTARVIANSASGNLYQLFHGTNTFALQLSNTASSGIASSANNDIYVLLFIHWNGGTSFIDYNNLSRNTANVGTTASFGSTHAATATGTAQFSGDFIEHIIYTSKPSDAEILNIKQRMISKFGILWE
jgi:PKD repeat protein